MADDPWSGMAFTDVRREEASPGANGQGIVLTIPDLSNDNTDGATWDHQE
jgi:hypothetical protein